MLSVSASAAVGATDVDDSPRCETNQQKSSQRMTLHGLVECGFPSLFSDLVSIIVDVLLLPPLAGIVGNQPASWTGLVGSHINPLTTVGHRPKRIKLHAKAPPKGVEKHCLPLAPWGHFAVRIAPGSTKSSIKGRRKTLGPVTPIRGGGFPSPKGYPFEDGGTPSEAHQAPTQSSIKGRRKKLGLVTPYGGGVSVPKGLTVREEKTL
jgi:hypothetical protein